MALTLNATHIGTATAVLEINGVNFLTDPFFSPAGTFWDRGRVVLKVTEDPALRLDQLPVIDAVLLSHEDHPDNLDELGRRLLDGRIVFTTVDGGRNLQPHPAVHGMKPWEEINCVIAGKKFTIIATPTQHVPGNECAGFIVTAENFGYGRDGLPNAIYFSGDTVYIEELTSIVDRYHIRAAVMNLGNAHAPSTEDPNSDPVQITMGGKDGAKLFRALKADVLVPMHYESWGHFTEFGDELCKVFEQEGISDKICWLKAGEKGGGATQPPGFGLEAAPVRIPTGQTHDLPAAFDLTPNNQSRLSSPLDHLSVPVHTMQFVFVRRGRRAFQRLNLRQAAALSTRASPAVDQPIRRVSHLSNARTATTVVKSTYSPIARLSNTNQWTRCYATAAAESKTGKTAAGRPRKTGAAAKKPAKPKAKKAKKAVKPKAKPTEEQLAKKKEAREKQKLKDEIKKSKAESLADTEPKGPLSHAWPLFIQKKLHGFKGSVTSQLSIISTEYKNLASSEREELSRELEKTNQESARAYDAWVNSHTPLQIKNANIARRRLATLTADRKNPIKYSQIKDERLVKRPRTTFILFFKDRVESGDLKHLSSTEMGTQATSEYNALSAPEKEKYKKLAEQDLERYRRECKEVYGEEP